MDFKFKHDPMRVKPLEEDMLKGCSPAARLHIRKSMRALAEGRAPTPSFKLYGKTDVSLVDDFFQMLSKAGIRIPEWQLEYEMSRKTKWGPQGGYAPWKEVKEDFLLYYTRPRDVSEDYDYLLSPGINSKYKIMHLRKIPVNLTLASLIAKDKINDRAAGWRDFNLSKKDPIAQEHAVRDARSGHWRDGYMYVFERFNKQKKRIFFPGPFSLMLKEAQYYMPFLEHIQQSLRSEGKYSPYTFWADKIGFAKQFKIVDDLYQDNPNGTIVFVQRDFEKMDTTTGFSQTYHALYRKLLRAFGWQPNSKDAVELLNILYYGSKMPVITPDGVYFGSRGKASGQETTNGDETCSNEDYNDILQGFLEQSCDEKKIKFRTIYSGGNGDDGISMYALENRKDLEIFTKLISEAANLAANICGFRVQGDKWFISTEYGLYCQNMVAIKNNHVWFAYPATLILNSIVNPEKQYSKADWDKDYRDLDIIEKLDNGRNLEYFHELVDFVDNGMKYGLLGRTEPETRRIFSKWEKYRALRGRKFNNYSDVDDEGDFDLASSPTINYLLSKRNLVIPR